MNSRIMQVKMCGSCIWLYNDGSVNGKDSRMSGGYNFVIVMGRLEQFSVC